MILQYTANHSLLPSNGHLDNRAEKHMPKADRVKRNAAKHSEYAALICFQ